MNFDNEIFWKFQLFILRESPYDLDFTLEFQNINQTLFELHSWKRTVNKSKDTHIIFNLFDQFHACKSIIADNFGKILVQHGKISLSTCHGSKYYPSRNRILVHDEVENIADASDQTVESKRPKWITSGCKFCLSKVIHRGIVRLRCDIRLSREILFPVCSFEFSKIEVEPANHILSIL